MSDNRKNEKITGVTPAGTAVWPKLVTPETKFNPDGDYSVKLRLPEGDPADRLIARIDEVRRLAYDTAVEEAPNPAAAKKIKMADPSYSKELDKETGEETGNWLFNFKMKASGISKKSGKKWERKPAIFDTKGTPITSFTDNADIWNGTELKVAYELRPFYVPAVGAGCSMALNAVQILNLVSGNAASAEDFGFDTDEEGYTVEADIPFDMATAGEENEQDF